MRHFWALLSSFISIILLWVFSYNYLPNEVAMHFDSNGNPDQYGGRLFIMAMFLLLSFVLLLITYLFVVYDKNNQNKQKVNTPITTFMIIFSCALNVLFLLNIKDESLQTGRFLFVLIGLFFVLIGNYLPQIKKNYFIGVRIAATLSKETIWKRTQRYSGFVFLIVGVLIALTSLIPITIAIMLSVFILLLGITFIYMYATRIEKEIQE
ncbi:SdpI family protein [Peribacillus sp. NPDC097675]|uniref:SdpI family protein n=1 Tax=Peribacillus sp. NPDC097675 TaxID=3390618 RepID=UPI003D058796